MNDSVKEFWLEFCGKSGTNPATPYQVWYFGNSEKMAKELAGLVISGKKKATASLFEFNEKHPEVAPIDDGYSVITDFDSNPLCVIQTPEIRHLPFNEVDAEFAFDEGEGDQTLADWRDGHWKYFTKEAAENELEFNEKSLIACERFNLLWAK
jgi:uncharacterized protein YhfF